MLTGLIVYTMYRCVFLYMYSKGVSKRTQWVIVTTHTVFLLWGDSLCDARDIYTLPRHNTNTTTSI